MTRRDKINYYLDIAESVLKRGTCMRRNFGAIIVKNDEIISTGYVGAPRGRANCSDLGYCTREKLNIPKGERYELCRSVHAEANAILNSTQSSLKDCTVYVTLFPCNECAKLIVQSRIKKVIYLSDKYNGTDSNTAAKKILSNGGVEFEQYKGNTISRDML